jgi:hypothetical protein
VIEWFRHKGGHQRAHAKRGGVWMCLWADRRMPQRYEPTELVKVTELAPGGRPFGTVCDHCVLALRRAEIVS